ncbi:SGNH/GDSL hydrolase family protein [Castellaniella ginsengisoli]
MKKLLIVGDSLSMSRHREGVTYEQMYSTLLAFHLKNWLVINGSVRANTSRQIISEAYQEEYVLPLLPDVVVLQIGVVDCLPRLMSKYERRILGVLERIQGFRRMARFYISFKSKRRLYFTKRKQIAFVEASEFADNIIKFRDLLSRIGCRVIAINIPYPGPGLSERTFGVGEAVSRYNGIIDRVFSGAEHVVVDLYGMTKSDPSLLQDDGYHIRGKCHQLLYKAICENNFPDSVMEKTK